MSIDRAILRGHRLAALRLRRLRDVLPASMGLSVHFATRHVPTLKRVRVGVVLTASGGVSGEGSDDVAVTAGSATWEVYRATARATTKALVDLQRNGIKLAA